MQERRRMGGRKVQLHQSWMLVREEVVREDKK